MIERYMSHKAPTPPMGWNSWDCLGTSATEEEIRKTADFMSEHLKELGWEYIVIDMGWYAPGINNDNYKSANIPMLMDDYGRLVPKVTHYPSAKDGKGFKVLADYIHSKGLKFGIHIMRGIPWVAVENKMPIKGTNITADQIAYDEETCTWFGSMKTINYSHDQAQSYYDSLGELYAEWGVDFVKIDDINHWDGGDMIETLEGAPIGASTPYRTDDVHGISEALRKSGREIVLSLSPGGSKTTDILHLQTHANMWRISGDFWDSWSALKRQFPKCAKWMRFQRSGHWPDADMLPIGKIIRGEVGSERDSNFSENEIYTLLSLWCLMRSPLMFGGYFPETSSQTLAKIKNKDLIEINQHGSHNQEIYGIKNELSVWTSTNQQTQERYIGIFNLLDEPQEITIPLNLLNIDKLSSMKNIWIDHNNLERNSTYLTTILPPHDCVLYSFS